VLLPVSLEKSVGSSTSHLLADRAATGDASMAACIRAANVSTDLRDTDCLKNTLEILHGLKNTLPENTYF
jgi:hypothetical protein